MAIPSVPTSGSGGSGSSDDDSGSSLSDYLTDEDEGFIASDGGIQWGDLSGAIVGGIITAYWTGVVTVQQAAGAVVDQGLQPIEEAVRNGGSDVASAIVGASEVWGVMDAGPLSLPVNAAFVLAALFLFAWVVS